MLNDQTQRWTRLSCIQSTMAPSLAYCSISHAQLVLISLTLSASSLPSLPILALLTGPLSSTSFVISRAPCTMVSHTLLTNPLLRCKPWWLQGLWSFYWHIHHQDWNWCCVWVIQASLHCCIVHYRGRVHGCL